MIPPRPFRWVFKSQQCFGLILGKVSTQFLFFQISLFIPNPYKKTDFLHTRVFSNTFLFLSLSHTQKTQLSYSVLIHTLSPSQTLGEKQYKCSFAALDVTSLEIKNKISSSLCF